MFSCGPDVESREADLKDILSNDTCSNELGSDKIFCDKSDLEDCNYRIPGHDARGKIRQIQP